MTAPNTPSGGAAGGDPSMEDILASIRRILSEDDAEPVPPAAPPAAAPHAVQHPQDDVLSLDASMLVDEPAVALQRAEPAPAPAAAWAPAPASASAPAPAARPASGDGLVGDAAASAAATSMGSLLRTLASERQQVAVYRGGPTLEDLVREEMRPILKQWLDSNLPPLVERLVRAEIERVVGRALS